jgi:chaperonin cofactor prefoldin
MSKIPEPVIQDWVKNKKRIQDRLNRIKKRVKKYQKQEKHFEMRIKAIKHYENRIKENHAGNDAGEPPQGSSVPSPIP